MILRGCYRQRYLAYPVVWLSSGPLTVMVQVSPLPVSIVSQLVVTYVVRSLYPIPPVTGHLFFQCLTIGVGELHLFNFTSLSNGTGISFLQRFKMQTCPG